MTPVIYGIPNCDSIRKAKRWLKAQGVDFAFHDYKKAGIDRAQLEAWCDELGWEQLLNRRGTTWRQLPQDVRDAIDRDSAINLMCEQTSIIKRPLLDLGDQRVLGLSETRYSELFPTT